RAAWRDGLKRSEVQPVASGIPVDEALHGDRLALMRGGLKRCRAHQPESLEAELRGRSSGILLRDGWLRRLGQSPVLIRSLHQASYRLDEHEIWQLDPAFLHDLDRFQLVR